MNVFAACSCMSALGRELTYNRSQLRGPALTSMNCHFALPCYAESSVTLAASCCACSRPSWCMGLADRVVCLILYKHQASRGGHHDTRQAHPRGSGAAGTAAALPSAPHAGRAVGLSEPCPGL